MILGGERASMLTENITLDVESDTARIFNDAPEGDKAKL